MGKVKVLFLCTHNSARSQMAEGLLRHFYEERYEAHSAGATPTEVHPLAVKVLAEIGIDISRQRSKGIDEYRGWDFDVVATVCMNTPSLTCLFCSTSGSKGDRPMVIAKTLHSVGFFIEHGFKDPSEAKEDEEKLVAFRAVRDEIKEWVINYFFYPLSIKMDSQIA
jgi:arsenate reductase